MRENEGLWRLYGCFLCEPLRQPEIFKFVLKIISDCSFRSVVLTLVKTLRSKTQPLDETICITYLYTWNNRRRNDSSLHDWHHNGKRDQKLYLLGANHNSKKKQNIE